jgi:septum formation protein
LAEPPLVLASRSPQRRAILEQLGVAFDVRPVAVAEMTAGAPDAVASHNAQEKARAAPRAAGETVLGVDTIVVLDGEIFGKPADEAQARATLRRLSGREHEVISAIALISDDSVRGSAVFTKVSFRALDDRLIEWYLASGEWRDRAGGYAIQGRGAALVESIHGDYLNVVGLPVQALLRLQPDLI